MTPTDSPRTSGFSRYRMLVIASLTIAMAFGAAASRVLVNRNSVDVASGNSEFDYRPREVADASGYALISELIVPWGPKATLSEIAASFDGMGERGIQKLDRDVIEDGNRSRKERAQALQKKAMILNMDGDPKKSLEALNQARLLVQGDVKLDRELRYSLVYLQGVTSLRLGENENCIMCRGESSCILPLSPAAVHTNPDGSRLAIKFFTEYLARFPNDLAVRWLLNVAHMTLGEYPDKVDPQFLVAIDHYRNSEFNIGKFRDIGHVVGLNQLTEAGGAIMEDFDNDGLLDIVISTFDPTAHMNFLRNSGMGTFEDLTEAAGLTDQLGGSNCVQTDYNNDGWMDVLIVRGGWLAIPMRPTLLRNNRDGTFTDVTEQAGLIEPLNTISASWADYDNDGWLDLFICNERQSSRLYHNNKNGTFEEVAIKAGAATSELEGCKGAAWLDYDNDDYPDLFQNFLIPHGKAKLFHNRRDGTFEEVTYHQWIDGPEDGFSCWAWDFDNDGWLDVFASCFDRTLADVVKGLQGLPHKRHSNRLYRNLEGHGFQDVTKEAGLDVVFAAMGSNFGDFDNDGFLDMYLGTGEPDLATLIPNRMLRNVNGKRFADISASSGTGSLQKGHGVACGDWDRDGNLDIFIEMGGAVPGDKYHNILFQNPGQKNHWLTVKLVGVKSNRAAIGARIKIVTSARVPLTIHRLVSSGSSFGANPLQQTIGLADASGIALLEIHWPTSGTTQTFRDLPVDQSIEISEFEETYRPLDWKPVPIPQGNTPAAANVREN